MCLLNKSKVILFIIIIIIIVTFCTEVWNKSKSLQESFHILICFFCSHLLMKSIFYFFQKKHFVYLQAGIWSGPSST